MDGSNARWKKYVKRYLRCFDRQIYLSWNEHVHTIASNRHTSYFNLFQTITNQGWMNMNVLLSCQWQKYRTNALVNTLDRCRGLFGKKDVDCKNARIKVSRLFQPQFAALFYPWYRCCTRKFTKNFLFLRRSHQMLDIAFCFASSFPIQKTIQPNVNVCRTLVFQGFYSSSFLGAQKSD